MTDTSGFYKTYRGEDSTVELIHAPNFVYGPNSFELLRENQNSYNYPTQGWYWFDSLEQAQAFFQIESTEI